jgi:uncharacterized protein (TIGR00661 family)
MRILYAIQGTGNGHISRARDIIPELSKYGKVHALISGIQADVGLNYPIYYRLNGLSFIFGKKGGVDIWKTYVKSSFKKLREEIKKVPVEEYDLVVNDFEPVTAWACRMRKVPCISLSHQCAILNEASPKPREKDLLGMTILNYYAPANIQFGFHFKPYGKNIYTPVIRKEIRDVYPSDKGHYTVYLPAFDDRKLIKCFKKFKDVKWEIFSKHNKKEFREGNVHIRPIQNETFITSMGSSEGVLCGAGFETPAETLYLKKKLMVIPMKTQYEQLCNAEALSRMGVPVIKSIKEKNHDKILNWLMQDKIVQTDYQNNTSKVIEELMHVFELHQSKNLSLAT